MLPNDYGLLHFFDDQWQARPTTTDGSFLSPDEVMDRDVQITFKIFLKRVHKNTEYWDDEIGTGRSIVLHYCPGDPVNIVQVRAFKFWYDFIIFFKLPSNDFYYFTSSTSYLLLFLFLSHLIPVK